jgi:hypothetical protein
MTNWLWDYRPPSIHNLANPKRLATPHRFIQRNFPEYPLWLATVEWLGIVSEQQVVGGQALPGLHNALMLPPSLGRCQAMKGRLTTS